MPGEQEVLILATVKSVAHADAVEGSQQVSPAGVLDCSTLVAMDAAGRLLLLETIGARHADDEWARRHFKNRSYQLPDVLESQRHAAVPHMATLIGDQRLVFVRRLCFDLA